MTTTEAQESVGSSVLLDGATTVLVDRVESCGIAWVWAGELREIDGARLVEPVHCDRLASA